MQYCAWKRYLSIVICAVTSTGYGGDQQHNHPRNSALGAFCDQHRSVKTFLHEEFDKSMDDGYRVCSISRVTFHSIKNNQTLKFWQHSREGWRASKSHNNTYAGAKMLCIDRNFCIESREQSLERRCVSTNEPSWDGRIFSMFLWSGGNHVSNY